MVALTIEGEAHVVGVQPRFVERDDHRHADRVVPIYLVPSCDHAIEKAADDLRLFFDRLLAREEDRADQMDTIAFGIDGVVVDAFLIERKIFDADLTRPNVDVSAEQHRQVVRDRYLSEPALRQVERCNQHVVHQRAAVASPVANSSADKILWRPYSRLLQRIKDGRTLDETRREGNNPGPLSPREQEAVGPRKAEHIGAVDDGRDGVFGVMASVYLKV